MLEGQRFLFAEPIEQLRVDLVECRVDVRAERDALIGQGNIDLATVFQVAHPADDPLGFQAVQ